MPESRSHGVPESRSFLVRYRRTYVLNNYISRSYFYAILCDQKLLTMIFREKKIPKSMMLITHLLVLFFYLHFHCIIIHWFIPSYGFIIKVIYIPIPNVIQKVITQVITVISSIKGVYFWYTIFLLTITVFNKFSFNLYKYIIIYYSYISKYKYISWYKK